MMTIEIGQTFVLDGQGDAFLAGITDLAVVPNPEGDILCTVSPSGGLASYRVTESGLEPLDTASLPGTEIAGLEAGIVPVPAENGALLLVAGAGGLVAVEASGSNLGGAAAVVAPGGGLPPDLATATAFSSEGATWVAGARLGSEAPGLWRLEEDGSLAEVAPPGTPGSDAPGITAFVPHDTGNATILLGAAAQSNALVAWHAGPDGLTELDRIGAADGIGIAAPEVLSVVEAHGTAWALLGAAGSSSITVAGIGDDGRLTLADHVIDSLDTRFAGITALEAVGIDGRAWIVAAGADDGLSLMELLPGGRLLHHAALADTAGVTLANVSDIALSISGDELLITVASASEPGLTLLTAALPGGAVLHAGAGETTGGGDDDLLVGSAGHDSLSGGTGHDVLMDGDGSDTLRGGEGADVFVLEADGMFDEIVDFDPGEDLLDLSAWAFLRGVEGLAVLETATGAELWYGDERLLVRTADGSPLEAGTLAGLQVTSLDRLLPGWIPPLTDPPAEGTDIEARTGTNDADFIEGGSGSSLIEGKSGRDTLWGGEGDDTLAGNAGNDLLDGGAGDDLVEGGTGSDTALGGPGHDTLTGSDGLDLLQGGDGNDLLQGNAGADTLDGGAGNDTLEGGQSTDSLSGGAGNDLLIGKDGGDTLDGGAGHDVIEGNAGADLMLGGSGNDTLLGGINFDTIQGGEGDDSIESKDGHDLVEGGAGDDILFGNNGFDTVLGGDGNDFLSGGLSPDLLEGGAGQDRLDGSDGGDTLMGGDDNDVLSGGNGHDVIDGGAGHDLLTGGQGSDVFVFTGGADTIADHTPGIDRIEIDAALPGNARGNDIDLLLAGTVVEDGALVIDLGGGHGLTLLGIDDAAALSGDLVIC